MSHRFTSRDQKTIQITTGRSSVSSIWKEFGFGIINSLDLVPEDQWKRISLKTNERILYDTESTKGLKSLNELKNAIRATFVLEEEH
jgi:hypothetical protein